MSVIKYDQIDMADVIMDGASNVSKAIIIGTNEGWDDYAMRLFRIGSGGHTPRHQHDFEHVVYVVAGNGRLIIGEVTHELERGDFALVPADSVHQFSNPGEGDFQFICIVPERGEY
jgi:quercetin dioxygenase-like cupin family protein